MPRDSFERFYYEKVGLGEGCGCAEHVTRIRDLDALAARANTLDGMQDIRPRPLVWLRRLVFRSSKCGVKTASTALPPADEKGARVAGS